jgi:hypothetical protein
VSLLPIQSRTHSRFFLLWSSSIISLTLSNKT